MVNAYPVSHTLQKYYLQIKSIKVSTPKASFGSLNKSDFLNRNIFTNLIQAGKQLALQGGIEDRTISACSKIEVNSPLRAFFLRGLYRLPSAHWYWNTKLKKNGAYADRFAQPYIE